MKFFICDAWLVSNSRYVLVRYTTGRHELWSLCGKEPRSILPNTSCTWAIALQAGERAKQYTADELKQAAVAVWAAGGDTAMFYEVNVLTSNVAQLARTTVKPAELA